MKRRANAGMTIPELIISMGILLLVLGAATALFKQAFLHQTLTTENLTNEQQVRVALTRINRSLSQASVEANASDFPGTPAPPIVNVQTFPTATATTAISFYRVQTLVATAIPSPGGIPQPDYYVHIISYDPVGLVINEYVMTYPQYLAAIPSPPPTVLATNVTGFGITEVTQNEFTFTITINNTVNPTQTEAPYTASDNVNLMN